MSEKDKPLVWLHGEVKTPPFSSAARVETGLLLRRLQRGGNLGLPYSRPMPSIGSRCHELRIRDEKQNWRLIYRVDDDVIVIAALLAKHTRTTPAAVISTCRKRLARYDHDSTRNDDG